MRKSQAIITLVPNEKGIYELPSQSLLPGPRTSILSKEVMPRAKDCMPHHDYIDFGRVKKIEQLALPLINQEPPKIKHYLDPRYLFIKCVKREIKQKKKEIVDLRRVFPKSTDCSTAMSAALKQALAIKLKERGIDPVQLEIGIRKKASRRGGRKHGKNGWTKDPETGAWFRTKTRGKTTKITVYSRPLEKGEVHVG